MLKTVNAREAGFDDLVGTLQQLVTGFAGDREPLGEAVTAMGGLTTITAGLLKDGRAPLKQDIRELGRLSATADNSTAVENFLQQYARQDDRPRPARLLRLLVQPLPLRGQVAA